MDKKRLDDLYNKPLKPPEESNKKLPIEHILKNSFEFFPKEPESWDFDYLEVGPGTGDFLFYLSEQNPQKKILGIEIGNKRFEKISKRITKRNITNITLMHGDARIAFYKHIPNNSLEKVFVLFPDPWPKNSHAHRRLLQLDFCQHIAQKLKPQGEFILATDVKDYAFWAHSNFNKIDILKDTSPSKDLTKEPEGLMVTFFKQKWIEWGRDFWYVRFKKSPNSKFE